MSDVNSSVTETPEQYADRVHKVWSGMFAFIWTLIIALSGLLLGRVVSMGWVLTGGLIGLAVGAVGLHPGERYFFIRSPERVVRFSRKIGLVWVRRWVVHGDRMNAAIRARSPQYRVASESAETVETYIARTRDMERIHLACFNFALVLSALALLGKAWGLASGFFALNFLTNLIPILLQRYNRARCQLVLPRLAK